MHMHAHMHAQILMDHHTAAALAMETTTYACYFNGIFFVLLSPVRTPFYLAQRLWID